MPTVPVSSEVSLHYDTFGDRSKPPLLLAMGLGAQMILWDEAFCELLAAQGFFVVRFDNRDAGLSTHLDHLGPPNIPLEYIKFMMQIPVRAKYTLVDMADDVAGLLDALSLSKVHLVGASMGGMIAQNFAVRHPTRIASLTSIMSTTGRRSLPQATWKARRALLAPPAKRGDTEGAVRRMMHVFRTISSRTHPPDEARLRAICTRHVERANNPAGVARQLLAIAAGDDRTQIVRMIKAPTLVMHGDEDPLIPYAAGAETARVIREGGGASQFVLVEGMGHDIPVPLWPRLVAEIAAHARGQS